MVQISDKIKKLPKKDLKKWISDREKENRTEDWKDELAKLKKRLEPKKDAKGTGEESKSD